LWSTDFAARRISSSTFLGASTPNCAGASGNGAEPVAIASESARDRLRAATPASAGDISAPGNTAALASSAR